MQHVTVEVSEDLELKKYYSTTIFRLPYVTIKKHNVLLSTAVSIFASSFYRAYL
jgi:hypothetical protein